ncbi:MAG TPA: hypothetical protein VNO26_11500 [Candidatus Limnocylindria bacterium]|nr:hypothetical protein [Candidatus Limnocylindria bacterium]
MRRPPDEHALARLLAHPYGDAVEALAREESFLTRSMFGCLACYAHGRLMLALAAGRPPWDGLLVATAREHHEALQALVPALRVHPVLGKWLYLPAADGDFERAARLLAELARADDPRIGVEPSARPRRARRAGARRAAARPSKI